MRTSGVVYFYAKINILGIKMKKIQKPRVSFGLDNQLLNKLKNESKFNECSISWLIRKAISKYLEEKNENQ